MLLSDGEIRELIEQDVLVNADKNNVGTITCDLRTKRFVFSDGSSRASCKLQHGDSAFVECVEGRHDHPVQHTTDCADRFRTCGETCR